MIRSSQYFAIAKNRLPQAGLVNKAGLFVGADAA